MIHPLLSIQARTQNFILKHFRYTPYGRYMTKIHNAHLGESCFIIGNGPSLTVDDLNTLHSKGIDTFAVNRIYQIFSQTPWRPTYYVSTDAVMLRDKLEDADKIPAKIKFIPLQNKYYLGIKIKGAKYFFRNDRREKDQPEGFSLDCTDQVNIRGTVTIACMQLAMHLGYKHIYLLGIDHNFDKIITENGEVIIDPSVKNYFIEGYDDDVINEVQHDLGNTTRAYYDVRRFINKTDVRIYNASRKTKLEAFERVTFEEAMEQIEVRQR
ncbi:MAG: 6-hydroxymethylpterin diphosphokinase MptE-like protein [Oscillospiraceae bacterium]|nr:6-hydroxymethylpterin diphosphokinase MptE-like protein [Oscillospiraceae bacterium]